MQISQSPANILLVTDDPGVFSLRESLSDAHELWEISSVTSAQKALNQLEGDSVIDAVVVGNRIADTDTRALLQALATSFPSVARVVIAQSQIAARALESARVADGAVDLPVDPKQLQFLLERTVTLKWRMNDLQLQQLVSEIDVLPSPPAAIAELSTALSEPQVEVSDVARIIESDPAMTAKLLQLVNSAAFGLAQRMTNIDQVVAYLGLSTVRNMLTAVELLGAFGAVPEDLKMDVEAHRRHAMAVAEFAQTLPTDKREQHDAFAAGMLHDIGLLALMACAPVRYQALKTEVLGGRDYESAELDILGASHAMVGAHLLERWMLPTSVCEAVARSHDADMMSEHLPNATQAVFVAEQVVSSGKEGSWWEPASSLPESYLESLNWTDSVKA